MSGGYLYGEKEPYEHCPYCGHICSADYVDIGVGMQQCGPFHCVSCHASEIGPYDDSRPLSVAEEKTGWYAPESEPGSSANVLNGEHVHHEHMKEVYQRFFEGNEKWLDKKFVEEWWQWQKKRKKIYNV